MSTREDIAKLLMLGERFTFTQATIALGGTSRATITFYVLDSDELIVGDPSGTRMPILGTNALRPSHWLVSAKGKELLCKIQ
jgi:hypothetical protein